MTTSTDMLIESAQNGKKEIDWVTALSKYPAKKVFEKLRSQVESDVEIREGLWARGVRFDFVPSDREFRVRGPEGHSEVAFSLQDRFISVRRDNAFDFDAEITLDEQGEPIVMIKGQKCELWQLRMRALENLFFKDWQI